MASQRLKKLDLPPEEVLRQLLLKMAELSDSRFTVSTRANARLLTLYKLAQSSLIVLRSLMETNEFPIDASDAITALDEAEQLEIDEHELSNHS